MSGRELQVASDRVASRDTLWRQFVLELGRLGQVSVLEREVRLVVEPGTVAHRFVVTADSLRRALVRAHAMRMRSGRDVPRMLRLPGWFLADLSALVGSAEDPLDEPFVLVGEGARLMRSVSAQQPPLPATYEPPSLTDFAPGGYWRTTVEETYDGPFTD